MGGYVRAMGRYAVFRGRASRAEYWQFSGILAALALVALLIDGAVAESGEKEPGGIVFGVLILVHFLPGLAVTVRRLHDTDRTGWLVLLNCLPVLNLIVLAFMFMRGTPGPNRFGPDPHAAADGVALPNQLLSAAGGPPVAIASPSAGSTRRDLITELERLGQLRKDGHLSEAEFEVMKAETLAQSRNA